MCIWHKLHRTSLSPVNDLQTVRIVFDITFLSVNEKLASPGTTHMYTLLYNRMCGFSEDEIKYLFFSTRFLYGRVFAVAVALFSFGLRTDILTFCLNILYERSSFMDKIRIYQNCKIILWIICWRRHRNI